MGAEDRFYYQELDKLGAWNEPFEESEPDRCPRCQAPVNSFPGMVGEEVRVCSKGCGYHWEDTEDAIRRVI